MTSLTLATVDTAPSENTGVLVERLWEASTDAMSNVEEWQGQQTSDQVDAPRRRWWPWAMATLSLVAAAAAIFIIPAVMADRDQATTDAINAAVDEAALDLAAARVVADTIVDPAADAATLSGVAVDLTRIDTAARSLLDQAVVAEDAGLDSAPSIAQAGELALSLERRLSTILTYRLLIENALLLPELPDEADGDQLGVIARGLSETITAMRSDVASLPRDELLDIHRADAMAAVDALEAEQAVYLAAIRDGDAAAARATATTMELTISEVRRSLDDMLSGLAEWATVTVTAIEANLVR